MASSIMQTSVVSGTSPDFVGWTKPSFNKSYMYTELNSALSGPVLGEPISAISSVENTSQMVGVTVYLDVVKTDLSDMRKTTFSAAPSDLWWDYDYPLITNPSYPTAVTEEGVVASPTEGSFAYRGRYISSPFADSVASEATVKSPRYFRESYLSIAETAWMHMGDETNEKQVHRIDLSFHKNSTGHLWAYLQSDGGNVSGQYKGLIQEHTKVFTNIRGRRFRLRLFIVTHKSYPWALREIGIGHLYGKSF